MVSSPGFLIPFQLLLVRQRYRRDTDSIRVDGGMHGPDWKVYVEVKHVT